MKTHLYYRILLLSLGLLAITFSASAQVDILWDKTMGGSERDELRFISPTSDGGYLLVGDSRSSTSGDKSEDSRGEEDYWVVKVDANRLKQWDKTYGGNFDDNLTSAIQTADGGYLLGGTSISDASGEKSENSAGYKFWVIKIDADGNKQWDGTYGENISDELESMVSTADGGYLLAGSSFSFENNGEYDYLVIKIDAYGNQQWEKNYGGSSIEFLSEIISTNDGGYLLAGSSESNASGDKSENSRGDFDYWIVKINVNGDKVWDTTLGGSRDESLSNAIATTDGGYLMAGSSLSNISGDKSENKKGGGMYDNDYWIVKIDASGNKIWDKTIGGNSVDVLFNATSVPSGGYLLAGRSDSSISGDKSEDNKGGSDFWLVKIDVNGSVVWDKTLGGSGNEIATWVTPTAEGEYLMGGYSNSPRSGDKTERSEGGYDFWMIKLLDQSRKPEISSLTLVNAETSQDIQELKDKDVIVLSSTGNIPFSVRANTSPETVHRVEFELSGPIIHSERERLLPYALFRDTMEGDYSGMPFPTGEYTLTVTPFTRTRRGIPLTITFQVVDELRVESLTLVNAETNQDIQELQDGDVINLAETGNIPFSVRANTSPEIVNFVRFELSGPTIAHAQREGKLPYALYGDDTQGNYFGQRWGTGSYTLAVTPFSRNQRGQVLTTNFEVVWSTSSSSPVAFQVYPVPTKGEVHVVHDLQAVQLQVLDRVGNVLLSQPVSSTTEEVIDLQTFGQGTYYLKLISAKAVETKRVVVE